MPLYGFSITIRTPEIYLTSSRQSPIITGADETLFQPCPPLGGAEKCPAQNFLRSLKTQKDRALTLPSGDRKYNFKSLEKLGKNEVKDILFSLFKTTDMICETCREMHKVRGG